jgi:hypothetical protein
VTGECVQCHSPYSAKHQDQVAWTVIGELVTPTDMVGKPKGVWSLMPPYKAAVGTSTPVAGFYFPAQHAADTTHAAWEGISCRVCHDVNTLDVNGLPTLRFWHGLPPFDVGVTPTYAYEDVASKTALCQKCHQPASDDDRTAPAESVHAGIACVTCHMTGPDGKTITHSLSAGKLGAALGTTACNQCHATAVPAGHPDVTTLETSFKSAANLAKYGADPSNLLFNGASRRNIHFITCDSCHAPTATATTATSFVYNGTPRSANFNVATSAMSGQFFPASADDPANVFVWSKANAAAGSAYTVAAQPVPGTGTYTASGITQNTNVYFTQATAAGGTFPGLGRGKLVTVLIKAKVTLAVSKAKVHPRTAVTISGSVAPNKAGKRLVIQKSRNGRTWTTWKTVTLTTASKFSARWVAPTLKGKYFFRAKWAGDKAIAANTSPAKVVTVF